MNKLPKHLGGHANITHLDEHTLQYIINKYNIKSAIDLGCGPGGMVELMKSHNINAIGIDGDFTITRNIECIIHDFTSGPLDVNPSDLCWTVEFLEHVKPEYIINYFSVISKCKYVFATASQSFSGHHHVNVHLLPYWIDIFNKYDFEFSEEDTLNIRNKSSMKRSFVKETGMFFIKS